MTWLGSAADYFPGYVRGIIRSAIAALEQCKRVSKMEIKSFLEGDRVGLVLDKPDKSQLPKFSRVTGRQLDDVVRLFACFAAV